MSGGGNLVSFPDTLTDNTRLSADILYIMRDQTTELTVTERLPKRLVLNIKTDFSRN